MPPRKQAAQGSGQQSDDIEAAEVGQIEAIVGDLDFDPSFLTGDVRDAMLAVLRSSVDWSKFDERRQRDINAAVGNAAHDLVTKAVAAIAAEGRETVTATIDQLVIKDGIKIVAKTPFDHDAISRLADAKRVLISVADSDHFDNARGEARVDPDQPDLLSSETDDLADAGDEVAADAKDDDGLIRTGDAVHIPKHGDCEVRVNVQTGMIEARQQGGDEFDIDVRAATTDELAAERERTADFEPA